MGKILQLTSDILTGATSVLAFKSYRHYRQDIATADQRVRMDGQTIQTAAGSINFNIRGEGVQGERIINSEQRNQRAP